MIYSLYYQNITQNYLKELKILFTVFTVFKLRFPILKHQYIINKIK